MMVPELHILKFFETLHIGLKECKKKQFFNHAMILPVTKVFLLVYQS